MTNKVYERLDGSIDQTLLKKFTELASEIIENLNEVDPGFDESDVIDFLTSKMDEYLTDTAHTRNF